VIQQAPIELLGHLNKAELAEFIRLLELARGRSEDTLAPLSCTGEPCREGEQAAQDPQK